MADDITEFDYLPGNVREFVKLVTKKVRYRKRVRADVFRELVGHFVDELDGIEDAAQRQQVGEEIIAGFGEPAVLGKLIRRGKKRCRPIWKKVLIAGLQIGCVLVLLVGLRVSTFYVGKPVIKIDYGKWLTEKVSAGKDPNLNAKIDIDRAVELADFESNKLDSKALKMWPGDMNDLQLQQAKKYLADNAQAIQALRDAANKPYFWVDHDNPQFAEVSLGEALFLAESGDPNGISTMKMLSNWRSLARMMAFNIKYNIYSGENDLAVHDCFVIQKIAGFFHGQGFLIEQLVGIAIEGLVCGTINDVLSRVEITKAQLLNIQEYYEKIIREDKRIIDWTSEKAILLDMIQRGFTDDEKGDGRVLAKGLSLVAKDRKSFFKDFLLGGYPGKKETIDKIENFYNKSTYLFELTPFQQHQQQLKNNSNLFMLKIMVGPIDRISAISWRFRSGRLGLVTVIAIKRYELETGWLPDSLGQLVELGYLDALPMDPFGDGALGYKVTEDDFVLCSVGEDFEDDGGKVEYLDNGRVKDFKGDDYIFWPRWEKAE